jgi:sec-independent protein translocase protein TatC
VSATSPKPSAAPDDVPEDDVPMTIWEHLEELRKRLVWSMAALIIGMLAAWQYKEKLLELLVHPFRESWMAQGLAGPTTLHFAGPGDGMLAYFKLSMIGGAAVAAPVVFYQIWSFVAPGLYAKEKRFVIPFVFFSTVLFVGGGYFGFRLAFPMTFGFFLSASGTIGDSITITPTVMMAEYISHVTTWLLAFGLIFEIPLFLMFLGMAGIVDHKALIRFSRYWVFIAFVVAAVITPPDVVQQLVIAAPMCALYFFSIGLVYLVQKRMTPEEKEADLAAARAVKLEEAEQKAAKRVADRKKAKAKEAKAEPRKADPPPDAP